MYRGAHTQAYTQACTLTYIRVHSHPAHRYTGTYTCRHLCTYIYIVYIHTHKHAHKQLLTDAHREQLSTYSLNNTFAPVVTHAAVQMHTKKCTHPWLTKGLGSGHQAQNTWAVCSVQQTRHGSSSDMRYLGTNKICLVCFPSFRLLHSHQEA